MHHFIFTQVDSFINDDEFEDKNFGLDKFLYIGSVSRLIKRREEKYTILESYSHALVDGYIEDCNITFTGSLSGTATVSGSIICNTSNCFSYPLLDEYGNYLISDYDEYIYSNDGDVFIFP